MEVEDVIARTGPPSRIVVSVNVNNNPQQRVAINIVPPVIPNPTEIK
jgi:hypothetical protein